MQQIVKTSDALTKKNIINRLADIPGGISLLLSTLITGAVVVEGNPLSAPSSGKRTVCKQAKILAGSTTTAVVVSTATNQFKVGDFVGSQVGGKAYAVSSLTDNGDGTTDINIGTAIDTVTTDNFIYQMSAEAAGTDSTFNIAFDNDTCAGLTPDSTSTEIDAGPENQETEATIVGSIDGAQQVETATIVGLIEAAGVGDAKITITSADVVGSPLDVAVAVANDDTAEEVAGKVRNALRAVSAVTDEYDIAGADEYVILIRATKAANDATLNIASIDDTCTGLTAQATSADTLAGSVSGAGDAEIIITAVDLTGTPLTVSVAVLDGDTTEQVAEKIRVALQATSAITDDFIVGGIGVKVSLTNKNVAAVSALSNVADVILKDAFKVPSIAQVIWMGDAFMRAGVVEDSIGEEYLATLDVNEIKY